MRYNNGSNLINWTDSVLLWLKIILNWIVYLSVVWYIAPKRKNKRIFIFLFIIFFSQNIFAHYEREMDILISLENNSGSTKLYKGWIPKPYDESALLNKELYDALISIDKKIKNSKPISINDVEKSFNMNAVYKIEYLITGKKYEVQNSYWIYETGSEKFYRCNISEELMIVHECYNYSDYYKKYYLQKTLNIDDCKNIDFIKWLFTHETAIQIKDKSIEIVGKQYLSENQSDVEQLPHYKIKISTEEYNQYKKTYQDSAKWKIHKNDDILFNAATKFELICIIRKNELIFGFRKMDMVCS